MHEFHFPSDKNITAYKCKYECSWPIKMIIIITNTFSDMAGYTSNIPLYMKTFLETVLSSHNF